MVPRAVIVIPPGLSLDSTDTQERITYALDRGYHLAAVTRGWGDAEASLAHGTAHVVIVARAVYPDPGSDCTTRRILPASRSANDRADRYAPKTPAQRFLDATATRWADEFTAWLLSE